VRIQLARALVRAGEKERALSTLDFGKLPGEFFREARLLANELWSERLARLERVSVFRVGGRGRARRHGGRPRWLARRPDARRGILRGRPRHTNETERRLELWR
jgi:hypothetical protein